MICGDLPPSPYAAARAEVEKFGWSAATKTLRELQYTRAVKFSQNRRRYGIDSIYTMLYVSFCWNGRQASVGGRACALAVMCACHVASYCTHVCLFVHASYCSCVAVVLLFDVRRRVEFLAMRVGILLHSCINDTVYTIHHVIDICGHVYESGYLLPAGLGS